MSQNLNTQSLILMTTVLLVGLSAGIMFTWNNAVTTGLNRLSDDGYLKAFQQMNRTILNPTFYTVFMGPIILLIATIIVCRDQPGQIFYLLLAAAVLYIGGVILITIFGNIPLNEMLDKSDLNAMNTRELQQLRSKFELKWNQFHAIRTYCSIISFGLLIFVLKLF